MLFSNSISSAAWSQLFRMLRIGLDAGLPMVRVFRQQSERGPYSTRPLMGRLAEKLADGDSLADALEPEKQHLPPLIPPLLAVGEETGRLGDTMRELENFFDEQHRLRRNFLIQIAWPAFELIAAIFLIALFLLVLDWFHSSMDPLGIGIGVPGVTRWFSLVGGCALVIWLLYHGMKNRWRFLAPVERIFLALPAVGGAMRSLLLSRFCVAMQLSLGAGLPVKRSLRLSFEATGSSLYSTAFGRAKDGMKRGASIREVMTDCAMFPVELLDAVEVGEEAGELPEVMAKQAKNYAEDAAIRLRMLAQTGAWLVYAAVAVMLIYMIFRVFTTAYLGPINDLLK